MKKKVLFVASVVSFIEWFNKENIEFLKNEMNCDVHIACNLDYMKDTDETRTKEYLKKIEEDGIVLYNIGFARSPIKLRNFIVYKKLKEIISKNHFDLIHCHTPVASMLTRLAARKARKAGTIVMYSCHGFHFHKASKIKNWVLYYPIEKWLSKFCDYIITINKEDFNRARTFYCEKVRYIPSVGVDIRKIMNTKIDKENYKQSIGVPRNSIMILSVGELIDRKNHQVIIKAIGMLKNKNIYYVICGKGPLLKKLKVLACKQGVEDNVVFLGFRTDIAELCNSADVFAFPSKIEGLGIAGIEAMSAGVPLVASNVQGILDYVIDGQTGYTCNPKDVSGFATAIDKLAKSKQLRESMRGKCLKAVEPFEITNALNIMWDIYREILDK